MNPAIILGIDIGTSGIRGCIVQKSLLGELNSEDTILFEHQVDMPIPTPCTETGAIRQNPELWIASLRTLFSYMAQLYDFYKVTHIVLDATSSTVLLTDSKGKRLTDALMYNDNQSQGSAKIITQALERLKTSSGAQGASSTLAKALTLLKNPSLPANTVICHQIDYLNNFLCGVNNTTDENNALKLGYDSVNNCWPTWVSTLIADTINTTTVKLPKVVRPGSKLNSVLPSIAKEFHFNPKLNVMAGTTDSIAGFLASGASKPGDCVTSLGSTLAVKAVLDRPLFNAEYGIYSHKLGDHWLVGGASNSGGAVILNYYSIEEITVLESKLTKPILEEFIKMTPESEYYPLLKPGERFPIADPELMPNVPKIPSSPFSDISTSNKALNQHIQFYLKLLKGISNIEGLGYKKLASLSRLEPKRLFTVGGGIKNESWMQIRRNSINTQEERAVSVHAAYGVTRLVKGF